MKRSIQWFTIAAGISAALLSSSFLHAQPIGQWDFTQGNLSGTVGAALGYLDGPGGATSQKTKFGSTTSFGLPDIDGAAGNAMFFPASTAPEGFVMPVNAEANGDGALVNQWTLIMDVLYPTESDGKWRALIETDGRLVAADADFFINPAGGIGISGRYDGKILPNTWYRIALVVDTTANALRKYINGELVGTQAAGGSGTSALDGRWALAPGGTSELFNDNDGETAAGYVSSIQLRNVALTTAQLSAIGGPAASGIPRQVPSVPAFAESWIPRGSTGNRNTDIGIVLNLADSTIADSSIVLKLDGATLTGPQITRSGNLLTVRKANPVLFDVGSKHVIEVTYTDSVAGQKTLSREFTAALFLEDFEGLALGPNVDEAAAGEAVWTKTPPAGWSIDDSQMFAADNPDRGVTEWEGWSFAVRDWWVLADDQTRSQFTKASGVVAIADPDEWDDRGSPASEGKFNSFLKTPSISLAGIPANSLFVQFDSSWRPECCDDGDNSNNQTATVTASFDGGAPVEILKYDSQGGSPTFKPDSQNETAVVPLKNPAGASSVVLTFGLTNAGNDWWWAIDNLIVQGGVAPPVIKTQPLPQTVSAGATVTLGVELTETGTFTYQWKKNGVDIPGATGANLTVPNVQKSDAGDYTVVISNSGGSITSAPATVFVLDAVSSADRIAQWDFDQGDLSATLGVPLEYRGDTDSVTVFTTKDIGGQPAKVMQFPGASPEQGYIMTHGLPPNGGGTKLNQYTLIMDVMFPTESDGQWRGLLQTHPDNAGDGDLFVNRNNGIGISGNYHGTISPNTWHRIAFAFDLTQGTVGKFIDGQLANLQALGTSGVVDDRWSLDETALLFTDEDNETSSGFVNSIQIRNRRMADAEIAALGGASAAGIPTPEVTGQWDFDGGDLSAKVGTPLQYRGDIQAGTTFSTATIGGQEAKVMGFPAATKGQGYIMSHGASANGGGTNVNQYTLIMDLMFPSASHNKWRGLFQTNPENANDGDLFVNTGNGIGISGQYQGAIVPDTWHRVAFAFDLTSKTVGKYIDGQLVNLQTLGDGVDLRWSLGPIALLFTDEDGETAAGFVNSIQFRNRRLSDAEIAALGGATATGIPLAIPAAFGGIRITRITSGANTLTLEWTGGTPPFTIQKKSKVTDPVWVTLSAATERTASVAIDGAAGFFQVTGGPGTP